MKYGYARVSTDDQNVDLQVDALRQAGCGVIFEEEGASGSTRTRPTLDELLDVVVPGDQIVVWKMDRLTRSLKDLLVLSDEIDSSGVDLISLSDPIDTSTSQGKAFFRIMGVLAELERDLIRERTKAGLQAAKARGKTLGRPRKLSRAKVDHAKRLLADGRTKREVCHLLGVSPATLWRYVSAS